MVCSHSFVGVAPGEAAQSRGDGVGSGSSRRKPSRQRLKPGWSQPVAEEGLPGRHLLVVKLSSGGFGPYKEERRASGAKCGFAGSVRSTSTVADWDDQRSPASSTLASRVVIFADRFAHRRFCGGSGAPHSAMSSSDLDSEPSTPRLAVVPRAAADGACRLALVRVRSDSAGRRRKTCSRCRSRAPRHDTEWRPGPVRCQGAMLVGKVLYRARETLVPLRPVFVFQKRVGGFQGRDLGQAQMLTSRS